MGKIALLFAGQGAQYSGMGKELYETSATAKALFDEIEAVRPGTIKDCFEGDLSSTDVVQPCMFAVDLACAYALREAGVKISGVAGFSLGEIPALAFSGMLGAKEAFKLVIERGRLMQECAKNHEGVMSAVLKLPAEIIEETAKKYGVYPVNYNSEAQTVVAGEQSNMSEFEADIKAQKGRCIRLKVAGAFHSPYMNEAAEKFSKYVQDLTFADSDMDVYSNVTGELYQDPKSALPEQICSPVRWTKTMANMLEVGYDTFIEVGPGKTLHDLAVKNGATNVARVQDEQTLRSTLEFLEELS